MLKLWQLNGTDKTIYTHGVCTIFTVSTAMYSSNFAVNYFNFKNCIAIKYFITFKNCTIYFVLTLLLKLKQQNSEWAEEFIEIYRSKSFSLEN